MPWWKSMSKVHSTHEYRECEKCKYYHVRYNNRTGDCDKWRNIVDYDDYCNQFEFKD